MGDVVGRRDVLVLAAAEQRRERGEEARRIAERPIGVQVEFEQVLAQEDHDLRPGQHPDVARQAELERVVADQPVTEGVERRDRGVRIAIRHELVDPHRHLLGRLVGEGQPQDLGRLRAARRDQPRDPARDDLGLAGPGASDHEQRPVAMRDGTELVGVEPAEQGVEPGWRGLSTGRLHDRHELAPGRQLIEGRGLAAGSGARPGPHYRFGRRRCGCFRRGGHAGTIRDRCDT